jgi:hypothetical protein
MNLFKRKNPPKRPKPRLIQFAGRWLCATDKPHDCSRFGHDVIAAYCDWLRNYAYIYELR